MRRAICAYPQGVEVVVGLVALGFGVALGMLIARRREEPANPISSPRQTLPAAPVGDSDQIVELIRNLPGPVLLIGPLGTVGFASRAAENLRLIRGNSPAFSEISAVARIAADLDEPQVREFSLRRPPLRKSRLDVRVRAIPLHTGSVLLLIDDLTEENRVATIRRDFIANVSHELKTPVGAISLLSEAMESASDDPAAVQHFATRMHVEANRLANLINDVIDLSRLQGGDPLAGAESVSVTDLVAEAVDFVRSAAEARKIDIVVGGDDGLSVSGVADQLVTAVRNLLSNAIAYSPENTQVAVAIRSRGPIVEIAVKDQGIGIDEEDQSRIFERFYRVDSARSRVTGGTGLGLAIVRNVCRNHGGDVFVWSVRNEGSTFTIQLPVAGAVNHEEDAVVVAQRDPEGSTP